MFNFYRNIPIGKRYNFEIWGPKLLKRNREKTVIVDFFLSYDGKKRDHAPEVFFDLYIGKLWVCGFDFKSIFHTDDFNSKVMVK